MKTAFALALGTALCAVGIAAGADPGAAALPATAGGAVSSGEPQAQARLVSEFSGFAGSDANARSLVTGLRQGSEITLTTPAAGGQPGTSTRFIPPTRPMDYATVRAALVLAREQLAQLGISGPTPPQISAVLAGGGIASRTNGREATPFLHPGVLHMRAGGMGWGKIAGTMGITLAQAMNSQARRAETPAPAEAGSPAAAGAAGGVISVAGARTDATAPLRAGAAAVPISSASIMTSSAGGPRTAHVSKAAPPARRPPEAEPRPETRPSKAGVLAAADNAARADNVATPVQEGARGGAVGTPAAAASAAPHEPGGSEDGQAAE